MRCTLGTLFASHLSVFDFQDQASKVGIWQVEVPQILEADFICDAAFAGGCHLDDLKDIVDEFLLRRLDNGKNFGFDGIPDIGKGSARRSKTITEMIQVWINREIIVRRAISKMKTGRNGKVGLYQQRRIKDIPSMQERVEPRVLPCQDSYD